MVKLIAFLKRNPQLSVEEFHEHWRVEHARRIVECPAAQRYLVRYEQNHRVGRDYERGPAADGVEYDGVAIQWFRSARDFFAMAADPEFQEQVGSDEQVLLDTRATRWILTESEETIIPPSD